MCIRDRGWNRLRKQPAEVVVTGEVSCRLGGLNAMLVIRCKLIQPTKKMLGDISHESRQHIGDWFSDGVQQHLHGDRAPSVPWKVHVVRTLNHRPMGLFDEQRFSEQSVEHNLGLFLASQSSHESRSRFKESGMVVQNPGFPCIVR